MNTFLIDTPRLKIRPLTMDDIVNFYSYHSQPEVVRFQGFGVMDLEQAKTFIASLPELPLGQTTEWMQYGIELKASGRLIGDCAIQLTGGEWEQAELGITLSQQFQNQGIAQESIRAWLKFLFEERHTHRVVCITDIRNIACVQLLRRCGFRQEGQFIENVFFKGQWASEYLFAMLRKEWQKEPVLNK